jgi:hypothetical protein
LRAHGEKTEAGNASTDVGCLGHRKKRDTTVGCTGARADSTAQNVWTSLKILAILTLVLCGLLAADVGRAGGSARGPGAPVGCSLIPAQGGAVLPFHQPRILS